MLKKVLLVLFISLITCNLYADTKGNWILEKIDMNNSFLTEEVNISIKNVDIHANITKYRAKYYVDMKKNKYRLDIKKPYEMKNSKVIRNDAEITIFNKKNNTITNHTSKDYIFGTAFRFEDFPMHYKKLFNAKIIKETSQYYRIKFTPKTPKAYSYINAKVMKHSWVPIRMEFYDEKGEQYKEMLHKKVEKINGYYIPIETSMANVKDYIVTYFVYDKNSIKFNKIIPKSTFDISLINK